MVEYRGIVPYLFYDDVEAAMNWYSRVFGFVEIGRWTNDQGQIHNAEMRVGNTELWLDGGGQPAGGDDRRRWIGVWVDDVEAMFRRVQSAGVACDAPVDRSFGVRMLNVPDGMGHTWGFMRRVKPT